MKYEYGVQYETNGERPDLPDDVLVHVMFNGSWSDYGNESNRVIHWVWQGSEKFRIVDERYKREEQDMNDDWYGHGEFPPVGETCEYRMDNRWEKCMILAADGDMRWIKVLSKSYTTTGRDAKFRPIRTEMDKLVEQMVCDMSDADRGTGENAHRVARSLVEQGYRKVKPMSEDEFFNHAASKYGIGGGKALEMYKDGWRFIEQ